MILTVSCQVAKTYQRPITDTNELYRDSVPEDSISIAGIPWHSFFADTLLQKLITKGLVRNLDMKIAVTRIDAARATFEQSRSAFLPGINLNAGITQSKLSFPQGFGIISSSTQYDLGISAGWEADIWGKLKSSKRAAFATLLKNDAAARAVKTRLVADIAANYYRLLALDAQLIILERTVSNRKEDVETVKILKNSNVVNGAAVVQSEAGVYEAEIVIPGIKKLIRETENVLNVLLANHPGEIKRSTIASRQTDVDMKTGIPLQLLQNRPDVMEAEYAFREFFENTNIARAYFYPSLTITAAGGFSSFKPSDWFTPAGLFANIAGGLVQPVFNKGINKSRLAVAHANQQEALLGFQKILFVAGQEVSDALYSYQTAVEQQVIRTKQITSLEKSVDFTEKLLRYSSATNYTDVLTSEQNLLTAQIQGVNDMLLQWQSVISLYRALGGGWK